MRAKRATAKRPLWITNISKKIVSIADLGIIVQPKQHINLRDEIHYPYISDAMIQQSLTNGSIFKMPGKIVVRQISPPRALKGPSPIGLDEFSKFPSIQRPKVILEEPHYEELDLSDEKYAEENAELAEVDDLFHYPKGS